MLAETIQSTTTKQWKKTLSQVMTWKKTNNLRREKAKIWLTTTCTSNYHSSYCRDYLRNDELDQYEQEGIDDEVENQYDQDARMKAERELEQRDRQQMGRSRRMPGALRDDDELSEENDLR